MCYVINFCFHSVSYVFLFSVVYVTCLPVFIIVPEASGSKPVSIAVYIVLPAAMTSMFVLPGAHQNSSK